MIVFIRNLQKFLYQWRLLDNVVMSDDNWRAFLREHPRATSLLFGAVLLLGQGGTVAATNGVTYSGP